MDRQSYRIRGLVIAAAAFVMCVLPATGYATEPPPISCTFTQGFWKNHPEEWPASALLLGSVSYNQTQLLAILGQPVQGNGLVSLAHQLIAAKLNAANGAPVPSSVAQAIIDADALIGSKVVPPIGFGFLHPQSTSTLTTTLDVYNNGLTPGGPPHCDTTTTTMPPTTTTTTTMPTTTTTTTMPTTTTTTTTMPPTTPTACMVIIDEDGVDNGMTPVISAAATCGVQPNELVNDDQPTQVSNPPLLWNELVGLGQCGPPNGNGRLVLMPTGQRSDSGWFAPQPRIAGQGIRYQSPPPAACNVYTVDEDGYDQWLSDFAAGTVPQACLDKVRDVMPLRNQELHQLVGKTCVAIVYDGGVGVNFQPLNANLQGNRYGQFTFKVEALELPQTGTSERLYDLWLRILAPQEPGEPLEVKLVDEPPDSIQVTQAIYDDATDTLIVVGTSNRPGIDTTPWWVMDTYDSPTLPAPRTDGNTIAYMTVSVDDGVTPDTSANPDVDPFILEMPMTFNAVNNTYEAIFSPVGMDLDGRRLSIQTDEGGVFNVLVQ